MIYPILKIPNKKLRQKCEPIEKIDKNIKTILDNMAETMYNAPGIGLAAVQIGINMQLVVIDCEYGENKKKNPLFLINPEIIWKSEEMTIFKEGCLSIPEIYEEVERSTKCRIRYKDKKDSIQELDCDGLLSTCVQHEIDHLNGKLFIDYLSRLKRTSIEKKFIKINKRRS
ncbi:MAG: peptide deformylase [Rhodobiaceae bacterium]|nr:peptide deformylase [Rhodobiaceae bacterium]|tara:strand:+ start:18833 stop:19345 length:513 start_codon:yes stop_codon:yes gene_type:complete